MEPGEGPVAGDGTYTTDQPIVQHDGSIGEGYIIKNATVGEAVGLATLPEYINNFPRDVVTALPGQVTTIRAYFDKPGRFNWHCHILSHEDHEMMRIYLMWALFPSRQQTAPFVARVIIYESPIQPAKVVERRFSLPGRACFSSLRLW